MREQADYFKTPHLARWYHHLNSLNPAGLAGLPAGQGVLSPAPADLQSMDRWILSRLVETVASVIQGFNDYNFPQVTH